MKLINYRFIYWRICCFACTREPRRRRPPRRPDFQRSISHSGRFVGRNATSMRRSIRSQRMTDTNFESYGEPKLPQAYSDPDLRCICN